MIWTADELSKALGGIKINQFLAANRVQFNSKDVTPGDLFIALSGGARDGHEFVADAIEHGASICIINHSKYAEVENALKNYDWKESLGDKGSSSVAFDTFLEEKVAKIISIEDTMEALYSLARYKRERSRAKFIAITGSAGKTSTKDSMHIILSRFGRSFASRGNFNNELGLAINLASLPNDLDYAVIELGMNAPGEISKLTKELRPDIAAITTILPVHLEYFGSVEKIAEAKCEIFDGIDKEKSIAILPRSYGGYEECRKKLEDLSIKNIRSFGGDLSGSDAHLTSYKISDDLRSVELKYHILGHAVRFELPYFPKHIAGNFGLCLLIAKELGLDIDEAAKALSEFSLGIGRGRVVKGNLGGKYFTIIADYYNCNPESLKLALENLSNMSNHSSKCRRVAILGDMGELGGAKIELHRRMIDSIKSAKIDLLILVGELAKHMADDYYDDNMTSDYALRDFDEMDDVDDFEEDDSNLKAGGTGMVIKIFSNIDECINDINNLLKNDDLILIKASRFMKFERIAKTLGIENAL